MKLARGLKIGQVAAALAHQFELIGLDRLAQFVVADLSVPPALGLRPGSLIAGDLPVAPVLQRLRRGRVMAVAVDDHGAASSRRSGDHRPRRDACKRRCGIRASPRQSRELITSMNVFDPSRVERGVADEVTFGGAIGHVDPDLSRRAGRHARTGRRLARRHGANLYRPALGDMLAERFSPTPAVVFYLLYAVGVTLLTPGPTLAASALRGALFGLCAYGTYDLTNQATLRQWPTYLTLADLAWGTILSAFAAFVAAWMRLKLTGRLA